MTIRLLFEFLLLDIYSVECFDMDILHCAAYGHSSSVLHPALWRAVSPSQV
jgi:hypothetical protein